jgi:hypothetical protein
MTNRGYVLWVVAIVLLVLTIRVGVKASVACEAFTTLEADMLAKAIVRAQVDMVPKKKPWTRAHAYVYEAYVMVNGMPPTDLVLEHYLYIKSKNRMNKAALQARMKRDLPNEVE